MDQSELEFVFVAGLLKNVDRILVSLSKSHTGFASYITSKELRFVFNAVMQSYNRYSSMLTEQVLIAELTSKGAEDADVLKYRFLFRNLTKREVTDTDFLYAMDRLVDGHVSRALIDSMLQTQEVLQRDKSGTAAFEMLEKNLLILKDQIGSREIRETSTERITEEVALYQDMVKNPDKYKGVKIGIDKLDEITGGFRKGELVIAFGSTKVGKSILLLNAQYNTMLLGLNSVYISIEMSLEQCRRRLVSRITGLPYGDIKNVRLTGDELEAMSKSLSEFESRHDGHSRIIDIPKDCTPKSVEAKIRSLMRTMRVDVVFLDYLLLMSPNMPSGRMSREERVTQISLELKQLARELGIPVITATQVNAKAAERREKTADESYDWTDIGHAKSVAANADWVLSLKREPDVNILNLGISAGRDGDLRETIPLVIDYDRMLIGNYVETSAAEAPDTSAIAGANSAAGLATSEQIKPGETF